MVMKKEKQSFEQLTQIVTGGRSNKYPKQLSPQCRFTNLLWAFCVTALISSCNEATESNGLSYFEKKGDEIIQIAFDDVKSAHNGADLELALAYEHSLDAVVYILNSKAVVYDIQGVSDSALAILDIAESLCKKIDNSSKLLAKTYNNKAIVFKRSGQLEHALFEAMKSYKIRGKLKDTLGLSRTLNSITTIYSRLNIIDSAIMYAYKGAVINLKLDKKLEVGNSFMTKGNLECELKRWNDAQSSYQQALFRYKKLDVINKLGDVYFAFGNVALAGFKSNDSALYNYRRALSSYQKSRDYENQIACLDAIGNTYFQQGDLDSAESLQLQSLALADSIGDEIGVRTTCLHLSKLYSSIGDISKASLFIKKAEKARVGRNNIGAIYWGQRELFLKKGNIDSALIYTDLYRRTQNLSHSDSLNRLKQEYDSRYKVLDFQQKTFTANEEAKSKATENEVLWIVLVILTLLVIALLAIGVLVRTALNAKAQIALKNQELQKKEVESLKRQAKLGRISNFMEGQEEERSRISRELHDSVGTMLSTVKIHFQILAEEIEKNSDKVAGVDRVLNEAHEEVRRISHNMASNVLTRFGLVAAVQDLVDGMRQSRQLKAQLFVTKEVGGLDIVKSMEIHLFRIIQEAINNTIKHAQATNVTINLSVIDENICLIIEDNGVGLEYEEVKTKKTIGLDNIRARVDILDGELHLDSQPKAGVTLIVTVPVS